jgi:hypothetical protein
MVVHKWRWRSICAATVRSSRTTSAPGQGYAVMDFVTISWKRMRSGDRPGLQNRRVAGNPVTGGFDPHSLPPALSSLQATKTSVRPSRHRIPQFESMHRAVFKARQSAIPSWDPRFHLARKRWRLEIVPASPRAHHSGSTQSNGCRVLSGRLQVVMSNI